MAEWHIISGLGCTISLLSSCMLSDAKRPVPPLPADDGDDVEREDELPTVVVLRQGDIGREEFLENRQRMKEEGRVDVAISECWP